MLKTKDTNPMHFFESTNHYFKIICKKGVEEYGRWMFNNGYNTALVECRIKVRELETKIQKLKEVVQQNESEGGNINVWVYDEFSDNPIINQQRSTEGD